MNVRANSFGGGEIDPRRGGEEGVSGGLHARDHKNASDHAGDHA